MSKIFDWLGHRLLGAFTAAAILYVSAVAGVLCFSGFALYEVQEFREIQKLLKQGKTPDEHLGSVADSCAKDFKDYLEGFFFWMIVETIRRIVLWISGLS